MALKKKNNTESPASKKVGNKRRLSDLLRDLPRALLAGAVFLGPPFVVYRQCSVRVPVDLHTIADPRPQALAAKLGGMATWEATTSVFLVACVCAVLVCLYVAWGAEGNPEWRRIRAPVLIVPIAGIAGLLVARRGPHFNVARALMRQTFGTDPGFFTHYTGFRGFAGFASRAYSFDALAVAMVVLLLAASWLTLLPPPDEKAESEEAIASQMSRLQGVLTAGAAVFVTGVLHLAATYNWSLAFIQRGDKDLGGAGVSALASDLVAYRAMYYALILAAAYVPPICFRRLDAAKAVAAEPDRLDRERRMRQMGVAFSPLEVVARVAAVLSPLLAGPASEMLKALGK